MAEDSAKGEAGSRGAHGTRLQCRRDQGAVGCAKPSSSAPITRLSASLPQTGCGEEQARTCRSGHTLMPAGIWPLGSFCRIIEWFGLEGTFEVHLVQPPAMSRNIFNWITLLRGPSILALSVSGDGASPTSLGNLCQGFTTLNTPVRPRALVGWWLHEETPPSPGSQLQVA